MTFSGGRRGRDDWPRPRSDRIEILEIVGGEFVGQAHRPVAADHLPPRRDEHPVRILGDAPVLPRRPAAENP